MHERRRPSRPGSVDEGHDDAGPHHRPVRAGELSDAITLHDSSRDEGVHGGNATGLIFRVAEVSEIPSEQLLSRHTEDLGERLIHTDEVPSTGWIDLEDGHPDRRLIEGDAEVVLGLDEPALLFTARADIPYGAGDQPLAAHRNWSQPDINLDLAAVTSKHPGLNLGTHGSPGRCHLIVGTKPLVLRPCQQWYEVLDRAARELLARVAAERFQGQVDVDDASALVEEHLSVGCKLGHGPGSCRVEDRQRSRADSPGQACTRIGLSDQRGRHGRWSQVRGHQGEGHSCSEARPRVVEA